MASVLYDTDFHAWISEQKDLLKSKQYDKLDVLHLLEEVEELGNSFRSAIESHLMIVLLHMIKNKYQPDMSCNSWNASIAGGRAAIKKTIKKNPSLRRYPLEILHECYADARGAAMKEMNNSVYVPSECPWTIDEIVK